MPPFEEYGTNPDLTETAEDATLRMVAENSIKLDEMRSQLRTINEQLASLELILDTQQRLLSFAAKVEEKWEAFTSRGIFGIVGGFRR